MNNEVLALVCYSPANNGANGDQAVVRIRNNANNTDIAFANMKAATMTPSINTTPYAGSQVALVLNGVTYFVEQPLQAGLHVYRFNNNGNAISYDALIWRR